MTEHRPDRPERADEQLEQLDELELEPGSLEYAQRVAEQRGDLEDAADEDGADELVLEQARGRGAQELPAQAVPAPAPEDTGTGTADEQLDEQLDDEAGRRRFVLYDTRLRRYVGGVTDERPSAGDPRFEIREV